MKAVIQALLFSFLLHLIYIAGVLLTGSIQTKYYEPDILKSWNNVDVLQNEVAFGVIGSPLILLYTFIGTTLISALVLYSNSKLKEAH
ncbi:hypothetical protein M3193_16360 [Sporosarcina luteola]|uniref:hypothetical protein n=1 Tax=Sporosarcina luteola TaxID=582850 RepID=UPI00203BE96E|nr:hypothetical protein [Sporosarcina luteola]MCM3745699.1 hypothetical protein [Sporosarcina luteola]